MKALVTGGAGFIGSNICKLLVEQGHSVVALDNLSSGYRRNLDGLSTVQMVEGDVRDAALVDRLCQGVDTVFHLAASVGNKRSIDNPELDADINVMGTVRLLEAVRRARIRKIVLSSSAGIFGELKTLPIREDHVFDPDTPYGASKLFQERFSLTYQKLHGIQVTCLRYFNVYGPHQRFDAYGNVIPIFAHKLLHNETVTIFGDGEQTRDFVHVRDVALANVRAAMSDATGVFNIGSGERVTINHMARMMKCLSGSRSQIVHGDKRPGDVRHSLADISAAQVGFEFAPCVELESGLDEYLAWMRSDLSL